MELHLEGRRALVPAASAGLGLAAAAALAAEGAHVAICGRDRARSEAAAATISGTVVPLVADASTVRGALDLVEASVEELGGALDILVVNGPGPPPGTFASTELLEYEAALHSGLMPAIAMCHGVVPGMCERGWGRIVAITSCAVRQPIGNLILSNTARTGLTGFLKTLATEVAPAGVTVNSVQPGLHGTDRVNAVFGVSLEQETAKIPTRQLGQADDFGQVVAFLCSTQARYVTGAAIPVDGGLCGGLQ